MCTAEELGQPAAAFEAACGLCSTDTGRLKKAAAGKIVRPTLLERSNLMIESHGWSHIRSCRGDGPKQSVTKKVNTAMKTQSGVGAGSVYYGGD